jgi:hypothetical protein
MHRLLAIGLVGTGLAIFGLACPATAMKPASNADLHRCLGMGVTEDNMICVKGGECAGAPPAGVIASCTGDNETSHCYIPGSLSGPAGDNYTCGISEGKTCTIDSSNPCVTYIEGVCGVTENAIGQSIDFCDTSTTANPEGNGTQTHCH